MPTEADVVAWEATTQQSDAYTEALTIVNEIETNPAIGIPTPHPLHATDSDVYAMDLEIELASLPLPGQPDSHRVARHNQGSGKGR